MNEKEIIRNYIIFRIILFFVTPAIIMVCYNAVGPTLNSLYTGKSKEEAETDFVEITFWHSLALYVMTTFLFKAIC